MNLVLMCRGKNHPKVIQILMELEAQGLKAIAVLAIKQNKERIKYFEKIQEIREFGLEERLRKSRLSKYFKLNPNGKHEMSTLKTKEYKAIEKGRKEIPRMTIADYAKENEIKFFEVENLNNEESVSILQQLKTDILILGGVPIIRRLVLEVPKFATLNVHMGLLPAFRGKNVAEWSVYLDAQVGVTVHMVDPGVDTGAILCRHEIDVSDCPSIAEMRSKVSFIQHKVLAQCARSFADGKIVPETQENQTGKQYFAMHPRLLRIVEKKLQQGYTPKDILYPTSKMNDFVEEKI